MTSLRLSSSLLISALVILLGLVLTQSTASLAASPSVFRATPQAIHSMALVNDLSQFDEFDNIDIDEFMAESSTGESSSSSSSTGMDSSSSSSTGDDSSSSSSSSSTGMESSSSSSSSTGVDSSSSSTASPSSSSSSSSPSSSSSSTGPASSSSSSSSGPQSSTGSVSSSTGTAPSVSIPAKFPLMSFVLTKPRSFFGGAASLTENVIPELATVCGIFNSRVVIMSMTESNNQTTIAFAISDPLVSTERTSVAAAEKFLAIKSSGVAPTTAVLQYLSLTSMGLQTDRTSMNALPQVSFKLNFDLTSLPGGSATEFSNMLRDEVAYIFSIRVSRITIVAIRPGSIAVDMIIAPSVLPTDPAASTIANEFVEQSRNTSSPLYTSGTITSQVIPNSAAVGYPLVAESADLGESSNDDIGVLSRGGFIALIVVASIAAITLVVLGVYIYAIRQPTATKNSTMLHSTENSRIGGGAHAADAAGAGDVQLTVMDDEPAVQPPETDRPVHFKVSPRIDEDDAQVQPAMSPLSESAGVVRLHTEQDGL